jgi:formylglycine-generating enzyme required for sulfatase activity
VQGRGGVLTSVIDNEQDLTLGVKADEGSKFLKGKVKSDDRDSGHKQIERASGGWLGVRSRMARSTLRPWATPLRRTSGAPHPSASSPVGVFDVCGNTWDWMSSAYDDHEYDPSDSRQNANRTEVRRVLRGGSWDSLMSLSPP